jgi:hypothetical protein
MSDSPEHCAFERSRNLEPRAVGVPAFDTTRFERAANRQLDRKRRTFPTRLENLRSDGVGNRIPYQEHSTF